MGNKYYIIGLDGCGDIYLETFDTREDAKKASEDYEFKHFIFCGNLIADRT